MATSKTDDGFYVDFPRPPAARIATLIGRIEGWEGIEDERLAGYMGEELLLDIRQCLESVLEQLNEGS